MEIEDTSSRVSIAFPLGLALLVALLLFFCCFFCCCLHWEKLQPLFPFCMVIVDTQPQTQADFTPPPHKPGFPVLVTTTSLAHTVTKKTSFASNSNVSSHYCYYLGITCFLSKKIKILILVFIKKP